MGKTTPRISDAEWEVMRVAWSKGQVTAQEVINGLADHGWRPTTIKTMLNRLLKKGALLHKAEGRLYTYRPAVRMEDCIRHESQSFLDRVFGGDPAPLLVHFVKYARLRPEDLDELRKILAEKSK